MKKIITFLAKSVAFIIALVIVFFAFIIIVGEPVTTGAWILKVIVLGLVLLGVYWLNKKYEEYKKDKGSAK